MVITRFCPTPNSYLHHGSFYTALVNQEFARRHGGQFVVQIDDFFDLFPPREIVASILEDLEWLEVCPAEQVRYHSANLAVYLEMLDRLAAQGKVEIKRKPTGCGLAQVAVRQGSQPVALLGVAVSSCEVQEVGYLPYASHPQNLLDKHFIEVAPEVANWRHATLWSSHPEDKEPWVEFTLPAGSQPTELTLEIWRPRPRRLEVLVKSGTEAWRRAAMLEFPAERIGEYRWAAYNPPTSGPDEVKLASAAIAGGIDRLRLVFSGGQYTESYAMTAPPEAEAVRYHDLCLGEYLYRRTRARGFSFFNFGRSASDVLLGTTHVIRGDELEGELDAYVQFLQLLDHPLPVLCHLPHLVDENGAKLSKSLGNGGRIVEWFKEQGFAPAGARRWIVETAYRAQHQPSRLHDYGSQLALLDATVAPSQADAKILESERGLTARHSTKQ